MIYLGHASDAAIIRPILSPALSLTTIIFYVGNRRHPDRFPSRRPVCHKLAFEQPRSGSMSSIVGA